MHALRPGNYRLRRRDFQFSIARLLVATTLCAVLLSLQLARMASAAGWFALAILVFFILFNDWSYWHIIVAESAIRAGNYPRAIRAYTRAIKADPEDPERFCGRARAHQLQRDHDAAIADYARAISLDSRFAAAWAGRAVVHSDLGDFEAAADDATIALCLDPGNWAALVVRGAAYAALARNAEALDDLNAAICVASNRWDPYCLRGWVYLTLGRYREALGDFDEAVQRGAPPSVAVGRSTALFKLRQHAAALEEIEGYLRQDPGSHEAICACSWFLATCPDERVRDGRRALELAETAQRLVGSEDWISQASLAAACAELGMFDRAIEHGRKALELAPADRKSEFGLRLEVYRARRPYRDSGETPGG